MKWLFHHGKKLAYRAAVNQPVEPNVVLIQVSCIHSSYNFVMPLNLFTWLLSLLPLLVVMVLMLGLRASGKRASAAGWVSAVLVSLLAFGGTWKVLAYALSLIHI